MYHSQVNRENDRSDESFCEMGFWLRTEETWCTYIWEGLMREADKESPSHLKTPNVPSINQDRSHTTVLQQEIALKPSWNHLISIFTCNIFYWNRKLRQDGSFFFHLFFLIAMLYLHHNHVFCLLIYSKVKNENNT